MPDGAGWQAEDMHHMMTAREVVRRAITFQSPDRLPRNFPAAYGDDFAGVGMTPSPDMRPSKVSGVDEWGGVWENIGVSSLGEVKEFPLKSWDDFATLKVPDVTEERRWSQIPGARERAGDKFMLAGGVSLYERPHFLRGLENLWVDIIAERENLEKLLDLLADMNVAAIARYRVAQPDGYMFCDDWGVQDKLMISPRHWREIWKPRYRRVFAAAHEAGMLTLLHSCGHIVDIIDDLIEIGLDVIQLDQQENMGLDLLSQRFAGRIAFWCPVDIQATMCQGSLDDIRRYCWTLAEKFASRKGGFIPKWYGDPVGAGHRQEAVDAMCAEFLKVSAAIYGA